MNEHDPHIQLIQRYLEHRVDERDVAALGAWIASDPANAELFVRFVSLHRQLGNVYIARRQLGAHGRSIQDTGGPVQDAMTIQDALAMLQEAEEAAHPPLAVLPEPPKPLPKPRPKKPAKPEVYRPIVIPWWVVISTGAVAAAIAIAVILPFLPSRGTPAPPALVEQVPDDPAASAWSAFVVGRAHASGDHTLCSYRLGDRIDGPLELGDETVEFQLSSGVVVVAVGPFEGSLVSQRELDMTLGKVVVDVGHGIGGFVVTTDDVVYRDIGTVFGVTLDAAKRGEVAVLQGEVVAEMVLPDGGVARRSVTAGQAARVTDQHDGFEPVDYHAEQYPRTAAAAHRDYRARLIERATLAYWRFEPDTTPAGPFAVSNLDARVFSIAAPDLSGKRNHLYHSIGNGSEVRAAAPAGPLNPHLPLESHTSRQSAYFPPVPGGGYCDLHSWSTESKPVRDANLERPEWDAFTLEFSFNPDTTAGTATVVGMDGVFAEGGVTRPAFACDVVDGGLVVSGFDSRGRYRALRPGVAVRAGAWLHVALVADGQTLRLYVREDGAAGGYRLAGQTAFTGGIRVPGARDWDGFPHTWTIGRGFFDGKMGRPFVGYIDEVRFCKTDLTPDEFLFAPADE